MLRLAAAAGRDVGYPLLCAAAELPGERRARVAAARRRPRRPRRRPGRGHVPLPTRAARGGDLRDALAGRARGAARAARRRARTRRAARGAGRARAALGGGRPLRRRRSRRRSRRRARRRPSSGSPRRVRISSARSGCGRPCPAPRRLRGGDLAEVCTRAAELAVQTGDAPRAAELGRQAIDLAGRRRRAPRRRCCTSASAATCCRAATATTASPPSGVRSSSSRRSRPRRSAPRCWPRSGTRSCSCGATRSRAPICADALALARAVGAPRAEFRALAVLGVDQAYLGRGEDGLVHLRLALGLAEANGVPDDLNRAYILLTDALTMLGRPRESVEVAIAGLEVVRGFGIEHVALSTATSPRRSSPVGSGTRPTGRAPRRSARGTRNWPHQRYVDRAELETGSRPLRGGARPSTGRREHGARRPARPHAVPARGRRAGPLGAALGRRGCGRPRRPRRRGAARRGADPGAALRAGAARAGRAGRWSPAPAASRPPARACCSRAPVIAAAEAAAVTPNAAAWLATAEAEHERGRGRSRPGRVGARRGVMGRARAVAARGVLPLAPGRGARRRQAGRAPTRPARCATATPSRHGSVRSRCCASSSCWPNERAWSSSRRRMTRAASSASGSCSA